MTLNDEEAPKLFKQCSRAAPNPEGPLWIPTAAEVKAMEAQLEKHVSAPSSGIAWIGEGGGRYRGQHVGFVRGGVKFIYASYAPEDIDKFFHNGRAAVMCDGGTSFWGIVFNTATGQFSELSANGR